MHLGPQALEDTSGESPAPRLERSAQVDQRNEALEQERTDVDQQLAEKQEQISWLEREVVRIAQAIRELVERIAERARERARPRGRDDDWGWSR